MSIILDALKRSDRERRLQKPPDLSQIYQENHPPQRKTMVWILLIVVVLIAGISGAYFFFRRNPEIENTKRSETAVVDAGRKRTRRKNKNLCESFRQNPRKLQQSKNRKVLKLFLKKCHLFPRQRRPKPRETSRDSESGNLQGYAHKKGSGKFLDAIISKADWARRNGGIRRKGFGRSNPFRGTFFSGK